ncbi:type IV pilus modification protein PilV [Ramlibacter sp. XY19]|uniref:type IV pilus modification protein PilV n=1 Tax=Ramlibacter paludis TaxID=2908000 RepID=UPI0023DA4AF3|nr:type IV pilus modification protein PilV [Ramlibacter paludis]MCG2595091.1 type IV pilus modification protein PilV [Ramlibacter paludis]
MNAVTHSKAQRGFSLVEVLVAIVVFSFGVLGLVRLQATAVKMSTDARQRAEATFLADQLLARLLISNPATATEFNHMAGGTSACAPTGTASTNATLLDWMSQVTAAFPRVNASEQQVIVGGTNNADVTIRLCWKNGEDDLPHTLEVYNRVQWP